MKGMICTLAFLLPSLFTIDVARGAERERVVVEAIIDTGATMMVEERDEVTKLFLAALRDLPGRQFAHARIDLILTSEPTTVWSGNRKGLRTDILRVLEKVRAATYRGRSGKRRPICAWPSQTKPTCWCSPA